MRRKYRADEVEAIVSRAAEIEASNPTMSGAMTMGGVEQVARDVGIDARHVRSAVNALAPRAPGRVTALMQPKAIQIIGGPTRLLFEREVEGEISEADYPVLVEEIRRVIGEVGQVGQLSRSFTWSLNRGSSGIRSIEVSVTVRNGRTRIMAQENLGQLIGVTFGAIGGGVGAGGLGPLIAMMTQGFHTDPMALAFIVPAWLLSVLATARSVYYHSVKRRSATLGELVDRLAASCRDLIDEARPRLPTGRGKADVST